MKSTQCKECLDERFEGEYVILNEQNQIIYNNKKGCVRYSLDALV